MKRHPAQTRSWWHRSGKGTLALPWMPLTLALALVLALTLPASTRAADDPPTQPAAKATDPLGPARAAVAAKQWTQAHTELQKAPNPANADWNNLMGYVLRKRSPPDLEGAERHYDAALRIAPNHRGALEYSGELYLMQGKLQAAEARLQSLSRACMFGCEEYTDLKNAVARFKANGNRHVPQ
jgi:tetratricopeptide (TPR) repeat protein